MTQIASLKFDGESCFIFQFVEHPLEITIVIGFNPESATGLQHLVGGI